ncbi:ABC transporter, permease protein [Paenibacillus larvae subsp. larvae]|uniref:ABC transporter, permease protein n=12 Tax=Paenibacillus larvae TaxID=1464 RepID=A0A6C0QY56_9BACL|nr:ABC transporter permease [Paenibacillus larvae]AQR78397.1 ABC transporter permease [Paenibacillus larvae subsp. larvae]AVF20369.1 ABC transporter, permease protein [Paenibacillus larvae subsp. larvae]MDR5584931.1 ABC transporter permease [Paenibacillus larvae]MDR5599513.1 ABC transporter permease [Paenibacillus larvae]MDT2232302.1 ABC transporter permease [Paenibacillus larvae]
MTLFNLALRNMKRNFKNYSIYFFSMIFSIVIYYAFVAIKFNSQIQQAADGSKKISGALTFASILLILFSALFIIYSNGFFTRKRKKEVGLYSLLGVRKRQIAKMLAYENLFMGLIALVVGIGIGALLSSGFTKLLLVLMDSEMGVHFEIPAAAVLNTALVFFVIILYTSFQGYRLIYRFKLIDLFKADSQGEKVPKGSLVIALLSVIMIGSGYYLASDFAQAAKKLNVRLDSLALIILFLTVAGTWLLFHFFTVILLRIRRKNKNSFYNGMNLVSTSQLLYRIKGNATTLATIAILSAVTLVAIGTSVSLYFNVGKQTEMMYPYSYTYEVTSPEVNKKVDQALNEFKGDHPVEKDLTIKTLQVKGGLHDEDKKFDVSKKLDDENKPTIIAFSEFKKWADTFGRNVEPKLGIGEAIQHNLFASLSKKLGFEEKPQVFSLVAGKETIKLKIVKEGEYPLKNALSSAVIVPDQIYQKALQANPAQKETKTRLINVKGQKSSKELTAAIDKATNGEDENYYNPYRSGMESMGIMIFVGTFVGLVFLIATGSIIYFKQLSEANADKAKYDILRKVGVTPKEMKKGIGKQIAFIFVAPLIVGILHSIFALKTATLIFNVSDKLPLVMSMAAYVLIYVGYYFLTVRSYCNIVRKN